MTMPETIWAWDDGHHSETNPHNVHAAEYVLRSSVQAMIDAAVHEAVSTPAPPLPKGMIVRLALHSENNVVIHNMTPPNDSPGEMVRFLVKDIPAVIAALRKIGGAQGKDQ